MAIDESVVMPDHFHGIIQIVGAGPCACPQETTRHTHGQPRGVALTTPDIIHRFKSFTTALYRYGVRFENWPPFYGKLWQRNYYEHITRNERELYALRFYIRTNPERWTVHRSILEPWANR